MKKLLLLFLLVSSSIFAQQKELEINKLTLDDFPKISGTLRVRDPRISSTNKLSFVEEGKNVSVTFGEIQASDSFASNKLILFLVLKTGNQNSLDWYQNLLKKAINTSNLSLGDQFAVASFNVASNSPRSFIYPQQLQFTDNLSALSSQIDQLDSHPLNSNFNGKNQVYLALNEALNMLENVEGELPKGIIVLSDDRNMEPIFQGEDPVERSKKLDIPIYGLISRNGSMSFEIEDLCKQTYGDYFQVSPTNVNGAIEKIQKYLSEFQNNYRGKNVPFSYTSTFEKDGTVHYLTVKYSKEQSEFGINVPSKNPIEWAEANPIQAVLLFIAFIVLVLIAIFLIKKERKKRKLESEDNAKRIEEMKTSQTEADLKLQQQNAELQAIRLKELKAQEESSLRQQQEAQLLADEIQFKKMLERGNLPWFEFTVGNEQGSYQIASPRLTIGRDGLSDWVISHPTVSRKHVELTFLDYTYTLKDLDSSNGTLVNGERIATIELKHGDVIQLGEVVLTFHI